MAAIRQSNLNSLDKQVAYNMFLRPQITYPLECTTLEVKKLKQLFRPVLTVILHSLGMARNFPLAVVHAGVADMGLGIDNLTCTHGVAQLQLLLGHLNKRDRTGQLLQIERDYIELVVGTGACPLDTPLVTTLPHFPDT